MPHLKGLVKPVGAFSPGLQEGRGYVATCDSIPMLGTPKKARVMKPLLISSPLLGTPEKAGVM